MTTSSRPRIAALVPMVWSVRNVVYSGLLDRLRDGGADVHLILRHGEPAPSEPGYPAFAAAAGIHPLLIPAERRVRGKAFIDGVVRSAFNRRHAIASYPLYRRWYQRNWSLRERARAGVIEALGAAATSTAMFETLRRWTERRYRRARDLGPVRDQLARLVPDLLWSTFCVTPLEHPYYLAARDLGIPVVTSILSFDNLTSRGVLPEFDHYFVWHEGMRDQVRRLYPHVRPEQITITGTPQFDFHRNPAFTWSRERTLRRLGLPVNARYVLYAGSHVGLAPEEPALVSRIAAHLQGRASLRDLWMVVRIHPLETRERWRSVTDVFPNVVVTTAWDTPPDAEGWTLSSPDDQARLISSLVHAEACINVASTITLDSAILDKPAIGIDFSAECDAPRGIMYEEYHVEHYRPLVERGGLRVAHSWAELIELVELAIADPRRDSPRRAEMVRHECGVVDGHAADRLAAALLAQVGASRTEPQRRSA